MLKAKLIENVSYYKLRRRQLLLLLLPTLGFSLFGSFYEIPLWITIMVIGLYVLGIILIMKNTKAMENTFGKKLIEIDETEIRIKTKESKIQEIISVEALDKLIIKGEYSIPQETLKEIGSELKGNAKKNYLILVQNGEKRRLDFEITTYFMITQLNKIIENWKNRDYPIERIYQE